MKIFLKIFIGLIFLSSLYAQEYHLKGVVTDEKQNPLPFAIVSVNQSGKGTSCNADGAYNLVLPKGNYEIVAQYLGYKKQVLKVDLDADKVLNFTMQHEDITLQEVKINASDEDPAYAVIRKTIKKRKYHNKLLNSLSYHCNIYLKGVQRLLDAPEKLFGMKVNLKDSDKGIIYLSETQSTYYFQPPDKKKEIIKASRVSGQSRSFSFNRYIPMQVNIYQNNVGFYFISDRPYISPISENALLFYKYKLIGTFFEDNKMINKIEIFPKQATDACFRGYLYIEENTWRVHSYDLYITKESKLNFIDTLWIQQLTRKLNDSLYLPVSIKYQFNFNFLGIKGNGYYLASVSDYNFTTEKLPNNFFGNEMVKFDTDAIKNDSGYWQQARPIPLSKEEKKDYVKKDSVEKITTSPRYIDSLDRVANKIKLNSFIFGYRYRKTKNKFSLAIPGLAETGVEYNTIEGINIGLKAGMHKEFLNNKSIHILSAFRYGIANHLPGIKLHFDFENNPMRFQNFGASAQYYIEPFNHHASIPEWVNTLYTLFDYRNYLKLYLNKSISIYYKQELINGLYLKTESEYAERVSLQNAALDIFKHKNYFTSNNPLYPFSDSMNFKNNHSYIINVQLSYRFKQRYTSYPDQKVIWRNKYPLVYAKYLRTIPINTNFTDYDLLILGLNGESDLKFWGELSYDLRAGKFFTNKKMYFMDYYHFPGNQTMVLNNWNTFRILNYYNYSTNDYFLETHLLYNFRGLIFGRLPILKKYKIQEIATAHYLYQPQLGNYYELSFGIDKLFYLLKVEYAMGFYSFIPKPFAKIMIGINLSGKE